MIVPITVTKNHKDGQALQQRLDEIFDKLVSENNPDDAKALELEAIKIYERLTGFKPRCGICIAGRNRFVTGLQDIKRGNLKKGSARIMQSLSSVRLKFNKLTDWFNG